MYPGFDDKISSCCLTKNPELETRVLEVGERVEKKKANLLCLTHWRPSVFYSNGVIYFERLKSIPMTQSLYGSRLNSPNVKHVFAWKLQREIKCLKCQNRRNIKYA